MSIYLKPVCETRGQDGQIQPRTFTCHLALIWHCWTVLVDMYFQCCLKVCDTTFGMVDKVFFFNKGNQRVFSNYQGITLLNLHEVLLGYWKGGSNCLSNLRFRKNNSDSILDVEQWHTWHNVKQMPSCVCRAQQQKQSLILFVIFMIWIRISRCRCDEESVWFGNVNIASLQLR